MVYVETLQKYALFGGMIDEQIEKIIPLMKQERYTPNELVITEGKPHDKIYFLIEGRVEVTKRDIVLSRFSEGEAFGEMEVLDVMPAIASIRAVTQVRVMTISNQALREIYRIDVKIFSLIIMNLARDLSRRLRRMDERMAESPVLI
jgi:CRP-like cAMP-binding protein